MWWKHKSSELWKALVQRSGINFQSGAQSAIFIALHHRFPGHADHVRFMPLHVGNNTGSLPVFMTSSAAQATGSTLDVGHGRSFCSHSRCGNVNICTIPCLKYFLPTIFLLQLATIDHINQAINLRSTASFSLSFSPPKTFHIGKYNHGRLNKVSSHRHTVAVKVSGSDGGGMWSHLSHKCHSRCNRFLMYFQLSLPHRPLFHIVYLAKQKAFSLSLLPSLPPSSPPTTNQR